MKAARFLLLLGGLVLCPWFGGGQTAAANSLALAVEAAYLVKFGGFVEWPQNSFPAPGAGFNLCVAGDSPFDDLLRRAARGEAVNGRPIEVRHIQRVPNNPRCQMLFLTDTAQPSLAAVLGSLAGMPVLTVTALPRSAPDKGIINFVIEENHVRFEIDDGLADRDGLRISSQLLALAVAVRRRS